jgi:hypothetical protein
MVQCTISIADAEARRWVDVHAKIIATGTVNIGSSSSYRCVLEDETGQLDLLFLGQPKVRGLDVGVGCKVLGRVAMRAGRRVVWNPRYQLDPPADPSLAGRRVNRLNANDGRSATPLRRE